MYQANTLPDPEDVDRHDQREDRNDLQQAGRIDGFVDGRGQFAVFPHADRQEQ